jgi:hypothetical protein
MLQRCTVMRFRGGGPTGPGMHAVHHLLTLPFVHDDHSWVERE